MNLEDTRRVAYETTMDEVAGVKSGRYGLDTESRDTILVHARQDAAHALCNTILAANRLASLRALALFNLGALVLVFCAVKGWI